jgi:hypothetical protein
MELEYVDHSNRRKAIIVVGVVLALVAGGAAFFMLTQAQSRGSETVATTDVIVAARDIPARTQIAASDLTTMAVPVATAVLQAMTDPALVVGRVTAVAIFAQQPVTPNLLASSTAGTDFRILDATETLSPDSPAWRAVAVNVPDDLAVGGVIQDGQHVDVFVTVQVTVPAATGTSTGPVPGDPGAAPSPSDDPGESGAPGQSPVPGQSEAPGASQEPTESEEPTDEEAAGSPAPDASLTPYYTDKSTKITYQDVPILKKNGTMYILRVDAKTAEEISHLAASGTSAFSFALRGEGDNRAIVTDEYGETTNRIIEQYGLPIPELYPTP